MRVLVTTNARLYKTEDGKYWTKFVYGYDFFLRYLAVFENVRLVAHTEKCSYESVQGMLRVDGQNLEVFEAPFPHGKSEYLKKYFSIRKAIKKSVDDCDAAVLRIPDQLAFQLYGFIKRKKIPTAVEVTSDSWELFSSVTAKSQLRSFLRVLWHTNQKRLCAQAVGTSYVTEFALQKRYPPKRALLGDGFTAFFTSANLSDVFFYNPREYKRNHERVYTVIHMATQINFVAKGYKELLSALGNLHSRGIETKLTLIGAGELSEESISIINNNGYAKNVRLTGKIAKPEDLAKELREGDLFVFPSHREGLPRSVLEAMASGLPCITTDLPGIRELLGNECLVPVKDIELLTDKIEEFVSSPEELTKQSKANYNKALEFHAGVVQKKREEFYTKLKDIATDKSSGKNNIKMK